MHQLDSNKVNHSLLIVGIHRQRELSTAIIQVTDALQSLQTYMMDSITKNGLTLKGDGPEKLKEPTLRVCSDQAQPTSMIQFPANIEGGYIGRNLVIYEKNVPKFGLLDKHEDEINEDRLPVT